MNKEMITRIKLTASEGHVLTDGVHYGKVVLLAIGESGDSWYEITDAEYEEKMKEAEKLDE